ncbi:hypothetical protein [Arsukibacterium sp.]|uniref:hypothetical protein n=1 Tax=Arsukibacterium sp. TaxID=1977258 RepID=UPI002FD8B594
MKASGLKNQLFLVIALCLPFLLLAIAEGALRLLNYGDAYPLFIPSPANEAYLQTNPQVIKRYFPPGQAPAVSPDTVLFKASKPANSFRIVIQGESTAAGFPYGRWGSLQGMLEQRFKREYPDHQIEIINTAMAGVTSYTMLDLAHDISAVQPDLVLIYAGHNEYLGVFGVGSAISAAGNGAITRWQIRLKKLRLYQLLERTLFSSSEVLTVDSGAAKTLMAKVAAGQHIEMDSPLYHKGLAQYRRNLKQLLTHYQRQQIPVLLGDLISNERDLPPFSAVQFLNWPELKQQLSQQQLAESQLLELRRRLQNDKAGHYYLTGLLALQQGDVSTAQQAFKQARDFDTLRFRAPSAFNQVVAELSQQSGVSKVAVEQAFRQHSAQQLIGNTLLLEHVHPNVDGYFLLAEQFYQAIVSSGLLGQPTQRVSLTTARQDVLLSELDIGYATLKIANLVNQYPFVSEANPLPPLQADAMMASFIMKRVQGGDWVQLQQQLLNHYRQQGEWLKAAKLAASLADAMPYHPAVMSLAANLYFQAEELMLASYYFRRAIPLTPDNVSDKLNLAHVYYLQSHFQQSMELLLEVQLQQPHYPQLDAFIQRVQTALAEHAG